MSKNRSLAAKALRSRRERGKAAADIALAEIVAGRRPDRTPVVVGVNVPVTVFAPRLSTPRPRLETPRTELITRGACFSRDCLAPAETARIYRRVNGRMVAV